jgi:hypothetical protein
LPASGSGVGRIATILVVMKPSLTASGVSPIMTVGRSEPKPVPSMVICPALGRLSCALVMTGWTGFVCVVAAAGTMPAAHRANKSVRTVTKRRRF